MGLVVQMAVMEGIRLVKQRLDILDVLFLSVLLRAGDPNHLEEQEELAVLVVRRVLLELGVMETHLIQAAAEADITVAVGVVQAQLVAVDRRTVME